MSGAKGKNIHKLCQKIVYYTKNSPIYNIERLIAILIDD